MLLHQIISNNQIATNSILIELLVPYKKSLVTYYKNEFSSHDEPLLMVTNVMNAAQYGKIVPMSEFQDAICEYLDDYNCMDEESENFSAYENICFNSIPLSRL
jgi:hypothetical protein